jgi:hypothetical protein
MGHALPPLPPGDPQPRPATDLQSLIALRDSVEDYLSTLERNTAAVNDWFFANKSRIILYHQRLSRAVEGKADAKAAALLTEMGDIAPFVLSLQDFTKKAKATLGANSAFLKAVAAITPGLPEGLQEPVPALPAFDPQVIAKLQKDRQKLQIEESQKEGGLSISSWFHKEEKRLEEQARQTRRQSHAVGDDILGLQGERHYYIDSLMDWVADTLAPEEQAAAADDETKMRRYQDISYMINTATADHEEAVNAGSAGMRASVAQYAELANSIDGEDVQTVLKKVSLAYPATVTEDSAMFKKILLEDYHAASLPEIILKNINDRHSQAELLEHALTARELPAFSDAKTPKQVLEKFARLTLDDDEPLDPKILRRIISLSGKDAAHVLEFNGGNIFQAVTERFDKDPATQKNVLSAILAGLGGKNAAVVEAYVDFSENIRHKDAPALLNTIKNVEQSHLAAPVLSLWHLCRPNISPLVNMCTATSDAGMKSALLEQGLKAGLLGEINVAGADKHEAAAKFKWLMEKDILPALDDIPVSTVRQLVAHSFAAEGLDSLRVLLTRSPTNWLEKIVESTLDDGKKTEWLAALLAPFKSDIVRANILAEAAGATADDHNADILSAMEKNLVGENVRLAEDKVLCQLPRIANIWYNPDSRMLRYTVQGQSHTLLENLSAVMAEETLSLLQRRGGFLTEHNGLFKPENIDAIYYTSKGTTLSWYHVTGSLNADAATTAKLKSRKDFVHATDTETGTPVSYNISSICLLQELDDGTTLLVDKYGVAHVLEENISTLKGNITLKDGGPMIDVGGAYFNPANASILRLDSAQKSLEFRVESQDFERVLDTSAGQYFYSVPAASAFAALKKNLENSADVYAPNKTTLSGLYFNMKALEYLAYDEKASGFYCKKYSPTRKSGFFEVSPETAEAILQGLDEKPGIVRAGHLLAHKSSIDDAYYDSKKSRLQVVTGSEIQEVPISAIDGWAAMLELARDKQFTTVAAEKDSRKKEMPVDVVQLDHATLVSLNKGVMSVIAEYMPFPLSLGGAAAQELLNTLEEKGLAVARQSSRTTPWVQKLGHALSSLPALPVYHAAFPAVQNPQALLQQALGTEGKKPAADFNEKAAEKKVLPVTLHPMTPVPPPYRTF